MSLPPQIFTKLQQEGHIIFNRTQLKHWACDCCFRILQFFLLGHCMNYFGSLFSEQIDDK